MFSSSLLEDPAGNPPGKDRGRSPRYSSHADEVETSQVATDDKSSFYRCRFRYALYGKGRPAPTIPRADEQATSQWEAAIQVNPVSKPCLHSQES